MSTTRASDKGCAKGHVLSWVTTVCLSRMLNIAHNEGDRWGVGFHIIKAKIPPSTGVK